MAARGSQDPGLVGGACWGSTVKTPASVSCLREPSRHPAPGGGGGGGGAIVESVPLFFLLVLFPRLHTEQCACVIFPLNFLSAASLAGESVRGR